MAKAKKKTAPVKNQKTDVLFSEIKSQIEQARNKVAVVVNQSLTHLYWNIGGLIHHHILEGNRAVYGKEIIATVSQQLTAEYGEGYTKSSLSRMMTFYQCFPDINIVATLSPKLSWSHFIELVTLEGKVPALRGLQPRNTIILLLAIASPKRYSKTAKFLISQS